MKGFEDQCHCDSKELLSSVLCMISSSLLKVIFSPNDAQRNKVNFHLDTAHALYNKIISCRYHHKQQLDINTKQNALIKNKKNRTKMYVTPYRRFIRIPCKSTSIRFVISLYLVNGQTVEIDAYESCEKCFSIHAMYDLLHIVRRENLPFLFLMRISKALLIISFIQSLIGT